MPRPHSPGARPNRCGRSSRRRRCFRLRAGSRSATCGSERRAECSRADQRHRHGNRHKLAPRLVVHPDLVHPDLAQHDLKTPDSPGSRRAARHPALQLPTISSQTRERRSIRLSDSLFSPNGLRADTFRIGQQTPNAFCPLTSLGYQLIEFFERKTVRHSHCLLQRPLGGGQHALELGSPSIVSNTSDQSRGWLEELANSHQLLVSRARQSRILRLWRAPFRPVAPPTHTLEPTAGKQEGAGIAVTGRAARRAPAPLLQKSEVTRLRKGLELCHVTRPAGRREIAEEDRTRRIGAAANAAVCEQLVEGRPVTAMAVLTTDAAAGMSRQLPITDVRSVGRLIGEMTVRAAALTETFGLRPGPRRHDDERHPGDEGCAPRAAWSACSPTTCSPTSSPAARSLCTWRHLAASLDKNLDLTSIAAEP